MVDESAVAMKKSGRFVKQINEISTPQDPVPQKPISANRGLNLINRQLKFIPWLDSVPECPISADQGINEGLNLIHLARGRLTH